MLRCHHGHIIQDSWQECPECWAEHDITRTADATEDVLIEMRRQSEILESNKSNINIKENAQQLASYAEERYRMRDLPGAIDLISRAINKDSDFLSFYVQRARYNSSVSNTKEVIADLNHAFSKSPEMLHDVEQRLINKEFNQAKHEIIELIINFKKNVTSILNKELREIDNITEKINKEYPGETHILLRVKINIEVKSFYEKSRSNSYRILLKASNEILEFKKELLEILEQCPRKMELKRVIELRDNTKKALDSITSNDLSVSKKAGSLKEESEQIINTLERIDCDKDIGYYSSLLPQAKRALKLANEAKVLGSKAYYAEQKRLEHIRDREKEENRIAEYKKEKAKEYAGKFAWAGFFIGLIGGCVHGGCDSIAVAVILTTPIFSLIGCLIGHSLSP